jgi:hypothetical protein
MSVETDSRTDQGTDWEVAFFDLFDPRFQPDAAEVHAAREACWYARTPLGYMASLGARGERFIGGP